MRFHDQYVARDPAEQLALLERTRAAAGLATVAPDDQEGDECAPVAEPHSRYAGTWRLGLAGGRLQ